jgi:hypothetical protein
MSVLAAGLIATFIAVLLALAAAFVSSLPVMWLWNAVAPDVFGLKPLTWVQALWLSLLCSLLFRTSSSTKCE